jgi:hypothetical protein
MRRFLVALLVVVVCSGCFRATTIISVKQDGSGTIDQEVGASAQALALLRNFGPATPDKKAEAEVQMFGPEQAQAMAAAMGVRFLSGEPVKTATLEGYRAHFAFDDVTKVRLNVAQGAGPTAAPTDKPTEPPFSFGFVRKEGTSVLTIKTADQMPGAGGVLPQMPGGGSAQENAQAMAMIMPMLRGLFVDVTLAVDGPVVKASVPAVSGSQLTLLQFDFDKIAATEGALQKLQSITDPKMLKDIPGVRMVTEPLITIEFGR